MPTTYIVSEAMEADIRELLQKGYKYHFTDTSMPSHVVNDHYFYQLIHVLQNGDVTWESGECPEIINNSNKRRSRLRALLVQQLDQRRETNTMRRLKMAEMKGIVPKVWNLLNVSDWALNRKGTYINHIGSIKAIATLCQIECMIYRTMDSLMWIGSQDFTPIEYIDSTHMAAYGKSSPEGQLVDLLVHHRSLYPAICFATWLNHNLAHGTHEHFNANDLGVQRMFQILTDLERYRLKHEHESFGYVNGQLDDFCGVMQWPLGHGERADIVAGLENEFVQPLTEPRPQIFTGKPTMGQHPCEHAIFEFRSEWWLPIAKEWTADTFHRVKGFKTSTSSASPSTPASTPPAAEGSIEGAIDVMLSSSGRPTLASLQAAYDMLPKLTDQLKTNENVLARTKQKLDTVMVSANTSEHGECSCTITEKPVHELFEGMPETIQFTVPHATWKDEKQPNTVPVVDPSYIFNAVTLYPLLNAVSCNQIPWLQGHTGTGKTTLIEQIYARLRLPLFRLNLDSDITRGELVGRETLTSDGSGSTITKFIEGVIPTAMQQACGLLIDEIDAMRPDLGFVLQRLTERKGFMLLEDGGRTVNPHPRFRMFATANTWGRGDETGLYSGTRSLGSAFINRFKPYLSVDYISEGDELELIAAKTSLKRDDCQKIAQYATEHRVAFLAANVTLPCSPRDTVAFAQTLADYQAMFDDGKAWRLAYEHTILNAADSDDRQVLDSLASRMFPSN